MSKILMGYFWRASRYNIKNMCAAFMKIKAKFFMMSKLVLVDPTQTQYVLTNATSRTFPEWQIGIWHYVTSVHLAKSFRVKFFRLREVIRIIVKTEHWYYRSLTLLHFNLAFFYIAILCTLAVQSWNRRILPQSL